MKKFILIIQTVILLNVAGCWQHQSLNEISSFNFDFEKISDGLPEQWNIYGAKEGYTVGTDSVIVHGGKYSVFIEHDPDKNIDFKACGLEIQGGYDGKKITLSGYIKTENVSDGFAGLWMKIDPALAFDNMEKRGITGDTDWKKYTITLPLQNPEATSKIVVGGLLVGKGKMWIDDLTVTIDGKDIRTLKPIKITDNEFSEGSDIFHVEATPRNLKTLKDLGLIWGFLKYYHPEISKGKYNWDNELFRIIPRLIAENDQAKRDTILVEWINGLGPISENRKKINCDTENIKITPDFEWITNSGFSPDLLAVLEKVKNAKRDASNHYVKLLPVKNPEFKNENPYDNMKYPDMGYRILSLYRYWNMIQYYFPYKHLIEENWKDVLEEFIPRFIDAQNETEYVLTVLELIGRVHDTHANIWNRPEALNIYKGINYAIPIITFIEDKAVVTGFYEEDLGRETALKIGDVIIEVDGKKTEDIVQEKLKITPASNYPTQLRDIAFDLFRTNEQTINISYISDNTLRSKEITAYNFTVFFNAYRQHFIGKKAFEILPDNIGYLYPASLKKGEIKELWKEIKGTKGLIIDLRCYPSDFIVFSLGRKLVSKSTPFVKFSFPSITTPGLFTMSKNTSVGILYNPFYYKGKVIILINETTQSTAEYHTMAFRVAQNATVIGSTTAGADGNVSHIVLPGGIQTMISGLGIYYPDGRETQRIGIIPDIELKPTIKGVAEGRDELLEKAIKVINER